MFKITAVLRMVELGIFADFFLHREPHQMFFLKLLCELVLKLVLIDGEKKSEKDTENLQLA